VVWVPDFLKYLTLYNQMRVLISVCSFHLQAESGNVSMYLAYPSSSPAEIWLVSKKPLEGEEKLS